jgi:hypothetical protein
MASTWGAVRCGARKRRYEIDSVTGGVEVTSRRMNFELDESMPKHWYSSDVAFKSWMFARALDDDGTGASVTLHHEARHHPAFEHLLTRDDRVSGRPI